MIRILFYLAVVFLIGLGFAWLADRPGQMVVTFEGYQYQVSLMVAAVAVAAVVTAVMLVWWLIKVIWRSPYAISRYFRVRQRDRGYQALSTGLIAAGAGDAVLARQKKKEAMKLISADSEPLIAYLDAQASLLEGDHKAARDKFEAMCDDPELRLIGLRGLYLEASRLGDRTAARHYAARAAEAAPQLGWAADVALSEKVEAGDWDGALKLVDVQKAALKGQADTTGRKRAVLLTAKAMSLFDTDPAAAKAAALEANRLEPAFAPAALVAARAIFRNGDTRRGSKLLEATWRLAPHPEIADLYVHARPGDAVLDRLARAKRLRSIKQNHPESALAVARAALDAHDYREARRAAETAIRMQPGEGAYLLLADIEEAETGDQGRMREFLAKAVRAPRDAAWVADGYVSEHWAPLSPVTGRLDAFEWKVPVERLGPVIDAVEEEPPRKAPPRIPPKKAEPAGTEEKAEKATAVEPPAPAVIAPPPVAETAVAPEAATDTPQATEAPGAAPVAVAPAAADTRDETERKEEARPALLAAVGGDGHMPDDPGVEPDEAADRDKRRFRLF